jgi:peptide/nickel transport system permease protein
MKTDDTQAPVITPPDVPDRVPVNPRKIAWARRRRALSRFWSQYRKSAMGVAGLVILVLFVGMALYSFVLDDTLTNPSKIFGPPLQSPNPKYPMGTDIDGISVLYLVIEGSRTSLFVGLTAAAITMVIGAAIGIYAGYRGGFTDSALMRLTDFFLVLPWLALAIVLASILGQNMWVIIGIIGFTSWPGAARLVRAQALSVKERQFVERSRALGGTTWRVVSRHILPNVTPVILANMILAIAIAILSESALSFLGLGDPLRITWGTLIDRAYTEGALTLGAWWWLLFPSLCIVLVVLAFTMVGFAFDEIINPRIRDR